MTNITLEVREYPKDKKVDIEQLTNIGLEGQGQ